MHLGESTQSRGSVLFQTLVGSSSETVDPGRLRSALMVAGLQPDDPRLVESWRRLEEADEEPLDLGAFERVIQPGSLVFDQALRRDLVIPDFEGFAGELQDLFEEARGNRSGAVADYIPKLRRVDPELFGLSICTVDGQRASFGDADTPFSAQCTHKPINYCLALEEHGEQGVHRHMGCEPSGRSFNEITLNKDGLPHNPMLNAGAIMCGSLIRPELDVPDRFDYVLDVWERLAGGTRPGFDNTTYLSERRTADRNFALTYHMREHNAFPSGTDILETLEFYIQNCSLAVTTRLVSVVAATLAAGGSCPLTGEQVFRPDTVQRCLSFMYSCGMYDYSGEWAFRIGLPAKSGVSGVVMVIVPNVMGLCIWSPRLESHGNSVRAIDFCQRLVAQYNFHNYDNLVGRVHGKKDPRRIERADQRRLQVDLCWAASEGDLNGLQRLVLRGADLDAADYDGRTPLHLAASDGRFEVVDYLLKSGVDPTPVDRWGGIPIDDARRSGHDRVTQLLDLAAGSAEPHEKVA